MKKNFYEWHLVKDEINDLEPGDIYFNERDIWWCYFGANVGLEQDGKGRSFMRPVVIFKKFSRQLCWVLPLSTKVAQGTFFFPLLSESNVIRTCVLPQLKMIDIKRLRDKIDTISVQEFGFLKEKINALLR